MLLTWEVALAKLRTYIKDSPTAKDGSARTTRFNDKELLDFWIAAQDDLVLYVARGASFTIAEDLTTAELPDLLYRIEVVKNADGYTMLPLDAFEEGDVDLWEGNYWIMEDRHLTFTTALDADATVFYKCYYPEPSLAQPDMPILIPRWALQACIYYCSALSVERQTLEDPQLRRWASKQQDAGTPLSNPFLPVAEYLLKRYRQVVYDHIGDANERSSWHSLYP